MPRILHISEPCPQSWNGMQGDSAQRFCGECQKHVHAISALSEDEAAELIASAPRGTLCIRVEHDSEGRVFFRDSAAPSKRSLPLLKMAMTASLLAACHSDPAPSEPPITVQPEPQSALPVTAPSNPPESSAAAPTDSCAPKRLAPGSLPDRPPAATVSIPSPPSKGDRRVTMGCVCATNDPLCSCL